MKVILTENEATMWLIIGTTLVVSILLAVLS